MPAYMKYVEQGHTDSGLVVHRADERGYAACHTHGPDGPQVWHNHKGEPKTMVPHPHPGPATCLNKACR